MSSIFDNRPKVKPSTGINRLPVNPESAPEESIVQLGRFPSWLHRKLPQGGSLWKTDLAISKNRLHTVCEEARCPNHLECWTKKTATFLVMGKECTRNCGFCSIDHAPHPSPLEKDEPERVVEAVKELGLRHVVITMVARDDLPDGGAAHLAEIVRSLKLQCPEVSIELLTSDFEGHFSSLDLVLAEEPTVFNHNMETVRELTPRVRHKATYDRSLQVLNYVKQQKKHRFLKSGIMVGLGETQEQVHQTLRDLQAVGCDIVTMGQYLQPHRQKLLVKSFITPEQFKEYEEFGHSIGIAHMYCGPFVRSSYNADLLHQQAASKI